MQTKVILGLILTCLITLSIAFYSKANKDGNFKDWIFVSTKEHNLKTILSTFNSIDTVTVDFGDSSDMLVFIPDGSGVGYIVYSEISENEHCIDYLWVNEAKAFVYWVRTFPIGGDDREMANEYYRNILNKYVYSDVDAHENNTSNNHIKNN